MTFAPDKLQGDFLPRALCRPIKKCTLILNDPVLVLGGLSFSKRFF
jgi:hypothetical protein